MADLPRRPGAMLDLHGGKVLAGAANEIVTSGREFEDCDVRFRPRGDRLFHEDFRVAEEAVQFLCHIRLIGRKRTDLSNAIRDASGEGTGLVSRSRRPDTFRPRIPECLAERDASA